MASKRRVSFVTKIVIFFSAFLLVMDGILGTFLAIRSTNKMKSIIQNKILEISIAAAGLIDGDDIELLTYGDNEEGGAHYAEYQKCYNVLSSFKTSSIDNNAELAYIYCLVKKGEDGIVFSVDPSDDPGVFLEEEPVKTEAMYAAFDGKAGFDDQSYVDRWGDLLSAYAPVRGKSDGKVKAIIGVDVWASWYKGEIYSNAIAIGLITILTVVVGIVTTIFITNRVKKRLDLLITEMNELHSMVHELVSSVNDPRFEITHDYSEMDDGGTLASLKERIAITQADIKGYIEYTHQQAYSDQLTGLRNRNSYFDEVTSIENNIKTNEECAFAIVVFDLNDLKVINDTYGHEVGDEALIMCGDAIKEIFGLDYSYRIGGDELLIIFKDNNEAALKDKLKEFDGLLKELNEASGLTFDVSISYGYAFFDKEKDTCYADVFKRADAMMYKKKDKYHKTSGRDKR